MQYRNALVKSRDPLVSIIIPTYNRRTLLAEAVQSCLAQTWQNLEIIVVDDGSTDGTDAFVKEQLRGPWAGRNIRCFRQQNSGAPAARNAGLASATGDYVQFLDSDDILFNDKITLQVNVLEHSENADVEGCSCYGQMGPSVSSLNKRIGVHCQTPQEYLQRLSSRIVHGMQTTATLWRRSFLIGRPGWCTDIDLGDGDDLEYTTRLLADARRIAFVDRELFLVRVHGGPRLSTAEKKRSTALQTIRTRKAVLNTLQKSGNWNVQTQKGFLSVVRIAYANILECGTKQDIAEMEAWILELVKAPKYRPLFPSVIFLRRLFGAFSILWVHKFVKKLRR